MWQRAVAVLCAAAACGGSSAHDRPDSAASSSDARASDSGGDGGSGCDPSKPFGTPEPVPGVNSAGNEIGAALSPDELAIYFSSDRADPTNLELYEAHRSSVAEPFGTPSLLASLDTSADEASPSVTGDGLTIYFARATVDNPDVLYLVMATRASTSDAFGSATRLSLPDTGTNVSPFTSPDGSLLYFLAPEGIAPTIYQTANEGGGAFGPLFAPVVNGGHDVLGSIVVSPDGLSAIYDARIDGGPDDNMWSAHRASVDDTFGTATDETELDSSAGGGPNWLSPDGCAIYFTSDRAGTTGQLDVWVARRP